MNKKTYRGVIFDLDGTLLDTSEGVFASVRHTVEALGKPALDEATLRTFIGPPVKLSLIRLYGLDEDAANHATEIFRTQYKDHDLLKAEPYAGIKDLIRALRAQGCKIGVATLKREDYALTLLEHYHFTELCDSICGSDFASKMTKADVLHKCLKALELSPSEAVLIGEYLFRRKRCQRGSCRFYGSHLRLRTRYRGGMAGICAGLYGKGYA